ncbi:calmodulin-binding transcription activator 4 isoform X2 [Cryptomeria japonica]|uniref:calmodulin-binding transcription activator 4 isoform X2 n=1 Tax=Cryptomeria japonica TaxID=3369 RepID=UPI0027DA536E|nr:calmodulin-binding transcription activator 4 isoform X2 [Cryptomeria japonica]
MIPEFDFSELLREAQARWLRPVEVLYILQNYQKFKLSTDPPNKPQSGSLFLFDRKTLRFFRKDGHNWRKKKDGKTVREAHERLKAGNADALHCYYAHGEDNPSFQRRSYWMLEEAYENIVLVHYREVTEGRFSSSLPGFSKDCSLSVQNQNLNYRQVQNSSDGIGTSGIHTSPWTSSSPLSVEEVSSRLVIENDELDSVDDINKNGDLGNFLTHDGTYSAHQDISCLQHLTKELSLDTDVSSYCEDNISSWDPSNTGITNSALPILENDLSNQDMLTPLVQGSQYQGQDEQGREILRNPKNLNIDILLQNPGTYLRNHRLGQQLTGGTALSPIELEKAESSSPSWKEMLELCTTSTRDNVLSSSILKGQSNELLFTAQDEIIGWTQKPSLQEERQEGASNRNGCFEHKPLCQRKEHKVEGTSNTVTYPTDISFPQEYEEWGPGLNMLTESSSFPQDIEKFRKLDSFRWLENEEICMNTTRSPSDYYSILHEQPNNMGEQQLEESSSVTVAQIQHFSINEICPDWAYSEEGSKVLIIGKFIGNPSQQTWHCMFGDIEVPAEIIQEGVLSCKAPLHASGKLPFCVTCGNREACSEIREFEYRDKSRSYASENTPASVDAKAGHDEILLQVRFSRMILSERSCDLPLLIFEKRDFADCKGYNSLLEAVSDDQWEQIEYAVEDGGEPLAYTKEWLLQTFLKEKLCQWLGYKAKEREKGASVLNKHGHGVLHMTAALGYEWAISPILDAGFGINFRDAHGWTALHWAARYGREKTVAALTANGASPGAVTDPTPQYPSGRTAADIAAANGHGGIAGYLAEASLTSHLSVLTLGENEISKASAAVEADRAIESVTDRSSIQQTVGVTEDQLSLKDSLAAVRNSAQAAARIQSAFRAHSFRKRQQKSQGTCNEYGITEADIQGISAVSKIQRALRSHRDQKLNTAATCIQRKFRGWKNRKEFLTLRQHVVKIQAHVRGHQVRKKYKMLLWTVGVLDKAILRWRRKGTGLRGFKPELPEGSEMDEEEDDEDILKVFRKQKVTVALDEAVGRVLHMVDSPEARLQYRRMLEKYQEVKAEYHGKTSEASSSPLAGSSHIEDDYMNLLE